MGSYHISRISALVTSRCVCIASRGTIDLLLLPRRRHKPGRRGGEQPRPLLWLPAQQLAQVGNGRPLGLLSSILLCILTHLLFPITTRTAYCEPRQWMRQQADSS